MGCDIHIWVERLNYVGSGSSKRWEMVATEDATYHNRNYRLFSLLAGVRNNARAAIKPISEPRGLPLDVSKEVATAMEDAGYHSKSWLTLGEIRAADLDTPQTYTGVVDALNAARIFMGEQPQAWSGDVFGRDIVFLEEKAMRAELEKHPGYWADLVYAPETFELPSAAPGNLRNLRHRATWKRPLSLDCEGFMKWLDVMEDVAYWDSRREEIRLVFAFDN